MKKYIKATDPTFAFFSLLLLLLAIVSYIYSVCKDIKEANVITISFVVASIVFICRFFISVKENKTNNDIIRQNLKKLKEADLPCEIEIFNDNFYDLMQKTDNIYLFIRSSQMYILGCNGCFKIDSKLKEQIIENMGNLTFSLEKIYMKYTKQNEPEELFTVVFYEGNKGIAKLPNCYILYKTGSNIDFKITNEEAEAIINGNANINDVYSNYLKLEALKRDLI